MVLHTPEWFYIPHDFCVVYLFNQHERHIRFFILFLFFTGFIVEIFNSVME